jgi:hypothetical protein
MRLKSGIAILALVALTAPVQAQEQVAKEKLPVIELTQTGCQFLEPEGVDRRYQPKREADCVAINNKENVSGRLKSVKALRLKPGKYVFRVTNKNVPYELGFWLRGQGLKRFILPSVTGAGLAPGVPKDYIVELKPGKYVYSCPLNPTPDYPVIVE